MRRTIALVGAAALLFCFSLGTTGCKDSDERRVYKKYKKQKKWKKKKHKKYKEHKAKAPEISATEARQSAKGIAKYVYKAAVKRDFELAKKVMLKEGEAKAFAKPKLFKKYANKDKMKEKFAIWQEKVQGAKFKKVKAEDDQKMKVAPGKAPDKFKELGEGISKEVTIWQVKAIGKKEGGKKVKCTLVAIKVTDADWRLLRIKGCKTAMD